ncbi:hypothetical protein [Streptomyces xanthophaeus]|uniref:hypothetical protein n=1 Tax=Streptomyces xanthophaeus TaxID=67385 RepID=UPI00233E9BB8|nr:hypothetical protein [Streptomyces xanthophaeus]
MPALPPDLSRLRTLVTSLRGGLGCAERALSAAEEAEAAARWRTDYLNVNPADNPHRCPFRTGIQALAQPTEGADAVVPGRMRIKQLPDGGVDHT